MKIVEYKGVRMSSEAAEIAERRGVDVWLWKRHLERTPAERIRSNNSGVRFGNVVQNCVIKDGRGPFGVVEAGS
jgi:hypothetical protein